MYTSEQFAKFIKETEYESLPKDTISAAKERILDTLGAAVAGYSNWEYNQAMVNACRHFGTGEGAIIGSKKKEFSIPCVAMINSTYAHSVELDDGHKNAGCHAGAVVVPTALAMAQSLGCSGKDLITAVVVGYEVIYRIASNLSPTQINKGFHPSSNCGVFGAMAVAGKLLSLNIIQLANGLGQAGMFASGTMESLISGQRSKCVQVGNAAYNGIMAAYFAQTDMEGCITVFDGKNGLFNIQGDDVDQGTVCRNLGSEYTITDTYNKMYSACRHVHPGIEAVLDIVEEQHITVEDVESISVGMYQVAYDLCGIIKKPRNSGEAKFSFAYGVAVALKENSFGVIHLTNRYYTDHDILEMANRVNCYVDAHIQKAYPQKRGARVEIILRDRRKFSKEIYDLKGSPNNPVGWKELENKFLVNSMGALPRNNATESVQMIKELEKLNEVKTLVELFSW